MSYNKNNLFASLKGKDLTWIPLAIGMAVTLTVSGWSFFSGKGLDEAIRQAEKNALNAAQTEQPTNNKQTQDEKFRKDIVNMALELSKNKTTNKDTCDNAASAADTTATDTASAASKPAGQTTVAPVERLSESYRWVATEKRSEQNNDYCIGGISSVIFFGCAAWLFGWIISRRKKRAKNLLTEDEPEINSTEYVPVPEKSNNQNNTVYGRDVIILRESCTEYDKCNVTQRCIDYCTAERGGALKIVKSKDGKLYPALDMEKANLCIECDGGCANACSHNAIIANKVKLTGRQLERYRRQQEKSKNE